MKIIALIPARSGSKRVKDKNIRLLNGIPLLNYSIRTAQECGIRPVVSTDSEEYADIALSEFAEVLMRPAYLCADMSGDSGVLTHFLSQYTCDLIIYLRPTTPLRKASVVKEAVNYIDFMRDASSLRSVEEMSESAFKCFTFGDDGVLKPILFNGCDVTDSPNQDCVKTYHPNGYVDIFRAKEVVAGNIWGAKKVGFITERTVEIDTEEDFEYAEWLESAKRRPWDALKRP